MPDKPVRGPRRHSMHQGTRPNNNVTGPLEQASLPEEDSSIPRTIPIQLSSLSAGFVRLKFNDLGGCIRFVVGNPAVLQESVRDLQVAARSAYNMKNPDLGDRCVQRLLILRHCQVNDIDLDVRASCSYLQDLQSSADSYARHRVEVDAVRKKLSSDTAPEGQSQPPTQAPFQSRQLPTAPTYLPYRPLMHDSSNNDNQTMAIPIRPRAPMQQEEDRATDMSPTQFVPIHSTRADQAMQPMSQSAPPVSHMDHYNIQHPSNNMTRSRQKGDNNTATHNMMPLSYAKKPLPASKTTNIGSTNTSFTAGMGNAHQSTRRTEEPHANPNLIVNADGNPTLPRDGAFDIQAGDVLSDADQGFMVYLSEYFKVGKVFSLLWPLPAGNDLKGQANAAKGLTMGSRGNMIYTKEMLMLVVISKKGYCICCPISTYGGYGLLRYARSSEKVQKQEARVHAIIYSKGQNVIRFKDEPQMGKDPLPVEMEPGREPLDKASRVHFGKFHTVEHNVAVKPVGALYGEDKEKVAGYFRSIHQPRA